MNLKVFAVRDRATVQFGTPMFLVSDGQAIRSFGDEVNRKSADNNLNAHPEDFDLYKLGSYDTETGLFVCSVPVQILAGKQALLQTN
jgi:hypothetical protein